MGTSDDALAPPPVDVIVEVDDLPGGMETVVANALLTALRVSGHPSSSLCVLFCDDEEIRSLNAEWRMIDEPTDVLSFPMEDEPTDGDALGDIAVSVPTASRMVSSAEHRLRVAEDLGVAAELLEWSLREELVFLCVHGFLHLLGHDHAESDEEAVMRGEERRLMSAIMDTWS